MLTQEPLPLHNVFKDALSTQYIVAADPHVDALEAAVLKIPLVHTLLGFVATVAMVQFNAKAR